MFYQLLYTSLPPIIFGVFDQDVSDENLMKKPELYKQGMLRQVKLIIIFKNFIFTVNFHSYIAHLFPTGPT